MNSHCLLRGTMSVRVERLLFLDLQNVRSDRSTPSDPPVPRLEEYSLYITDVTSSLRDFRGNRNCNVPSTIYWLISSWLLTWFCDFDFLRLRRKNFTDKFTSRRKNNRTWVCNRLSWVNNRNPQKYCESWLKLTL